MTSFVKPLSTPATGSVNRSAPPAALMLRLSDTTELELMRRDIREIALNGSRAQLSEYDELTFGYDSDRTSANSQRLSPRDNFVGPDWCMFDCGQSSLYHRGQGGCGATRGQHYMTPRGGNLVVVAKDPPSPWDCTSPTWHSLAWVPLTGLPSSASRTTCAPTWSTHSPPALPLPAPPLPTFPQQLRRLLSTPTRSILITWRLPPVYSPSSVLACW